MKISVITPSFNSSATIRDTITSVLSQTYSDIEYIIIDGGSTDGTLDIIGEFLNKISCVISEPDRGIYDAMNKGISVATGEVIAILNSDDLFASADILAQVAGVFEGSDAQICFGDIVYVDQGNSRVTRTWKPGPFVRDAMRTGWAAPHPAFFVRRCVYESAGVYRTDFRLAADYEFMLRALYVHDISSAYMDAVCVRMREGGASAGSLKKRIQGWRELKRAWSVNGLPIPPFFIARRVIGKLFQFRIF